MARQDINTEFNTFVGGILTEANPINYPVGFTLDEENFILKRNGTRQRRRGLEVSDQSTNTTLKYQQTGSWRGYGSFVWEEEELLVVWAYGVVSTFNIDTSGSIESTETVIHNTSNEDILAVSTYQKYILVVKSQTRTFTRLSGSTENRTIPQVLVYDTSGTLVTTEDLKMRDFVGAIDGLEIDERPAALSNEHEYNLINQGWNSTNITAFDSAIGDFPSNADNMNSGLDSSTGVFTASWVDLANNGSTKTAQGGLIVDVSQRSVSREEALYNIVGATAGGLSSLNINIQSIEVAEAFGRVFYLTSTSGSNNSEQTLLMFSQAGEDESVIGKCYQRNAPTSRDFNTLVDSDGGVLDVSFIGKALKMKVLKDRIFLFATKGVFEVFSSTSVFTPLSVSIRKVSEEAALEDPSSLNGIGGNHVVVANDSIFYWARAGIMQVTYDSSSGLYVAVNITANKIDTLYSQIRTASKRNASGFYVPSDQTIRFLYNNNEDLTSDQGGDLWYYTTELIYDTVLKSWYKNRFYADLTNGAHADGSYFITSGFLKAGGNNLDTGLGLETAIRYIVVERESGSNTQGIHFANYSTSEFKDYVGLSGEGEKQAFMQTGYINAGDSQRYKQADYIIPSFIRTEDGFTDDGSGNLTPTNESSCNITAYWDYADTTAGNKIGTAFEAYRYNRLYIPSGPADTFDYGQSVITTKNKLLGRGRALSLRFETSAGKDCRLLGWGLGFEINQRV